MLQLAVYLRLGDIGNLFEKKIGNEILTHSWPQVCLSWFIHWLNFLVFNPCVYFQAWFISSGGRSKSECFSRIMICWKIVLGLARSVSSGNFLEMHTLRSSHAHVLSCFSRVWLYDPMDHSPPGSSVHGVSPGKNTGLGCHALLQGIFPTQGSNPRLLCLLHWQVVSSPLAPPGKPQALQSPPNSEIVRRGVIINSFPVDFDAL